MKMCIDHVFETIYQMVLDMPRGNDMYKEMLKDTADAEAKEGTYQFLWIRKVDVGGEEE